MSSAFATVATRDEWMTVTAARMLWNRCVCFVGIGLPSAACNLARLTHAPDIVLVYESGTIGTRPDVLPLSIGDGELADTAACVVSLPEVFAYYLQAGRVDVGFLGAAQIDRFGNLNSTVIGPYELPMTRLPGAGGAPEIAAHAKQTFVMLKASPRSCVERLDFRTTTGFVEGHGARARSGLRGTGPRAVITDFGVLTPHPDTEELQLSALFADASADEARAAIGWPLRLADDIDLLAAPTALELDTLRALKARTREAHARPVRLPAWTPVTDLATERS
jgi:glutaconate CoA-transferase subunit B